MPLQQTILIEMGEIKVSKDKTEILSCGNLGSSMAVVMFDAANRIAGIAHVVLPDSAVDKNMGQLKTPEKYADLAIPTLAELFFQEGGQKPNTTIRIVGGAQMFNFGGGGGNFLNIGSRNNIAIRAALSKLGFAVDKAEIGGNKARSLRLLIATGQLYVKRIGENEVIL